MTTTFYIIFLFYAISAIYFATKRNNSMLYFFLIAVVFQNIICIIAYNYVPAISIKAFTLVKEAMLYMSIVFGIMCSFKIKAEKKSWYHYFVSMYIIMIAINFIFTPVPIQTRILVARFLLLPIICIGIGRLLTIQNNAIPRLLRFLLRLGIFLAATGIIEFIIGDVFWTKIGYSQYAIDIKGNTPWGLINGVTANFYTYDFGTMLRRIVTYTADPLASAFLMSLAFGVATFRKNLSITRKRIGIYNFYWIFLAIICVLTLSKAALINMVILLMIKIYYNKKIPKAISRLFFTFLLVIVNLNVRKMILGADNSVAVHFNGFINGMMSSGLFGNGLGTAGASASMLAAAEVEVAESFIGSMAVQIGVVGLVGFLGMMYQILKKLNKNYRNTHNDFFLLCKGLFCGLIVSIFFSESSVTIMGTGIYFILLGLATRDYKETGLAIKGETNE